MDQLIQSLKSKVRSSRGLISRECSHLVFSGERDGPLVPGVAEVLGDDVAVEVARHGLRDDEREDLGVDAVVQLKVASQERHLAENWRI